MKLMPRTAAYRIGLLSAAAFALATFLIGLAVLYAVHTAFQRQLDASIRQATTGLLSEFADDGHEGLAEAIAVREQRASNLLGYAVFFPDGRRRAGMLDTPMPPAGWQRIVFRDPIEGPDPGRALTTDLPDGSRLVVAADLEPVEAMDQTIVLVFALGFLAIMALGAILAIVLGRYLKRRLEAIALGSRAFAAGDYGGRAEVGERNDEFDQLASSLNAMLDRIEALLRNLRQVTSDLAHDMRTPLTQLRGQLENLLLAPEAERLDRAETAIDKCDDILRLFTAILRISEVEGGELHRHFRPLDLAALVREIAEAHEPMAEESGHKLDVVVPGEAVLVRGDRELLAQALINLLENAFRHTPPGTRIEIGAARTSSSPCLYVRDNGPGIPAAERDRATQRFIRLDAARSTPGHGLGLSLVKAIADAHAARLELKDAGPGLDARIIFERGKA